MLKYEDVFFTRTRSVFLEVEKHIEDQNFPSKKSKENDISRINFLEISFSKIDFQNKLEVLKSRDEKSNLDILSGTV